MKRVISASRRTDLVASFPEWLAAALRARQAHIGPPAGGARVVDLDPGTVHTVVLWSKDFANLTGNRHGLRDLLRDYAQLYFHFTVTGLGGTSLETGVPSPGEALRQLGPLVEIAGLPGRVSLRFDPVISWREAGRDMTNLQAFADSRGRGRVAGHPGRPVQLRPVVREVAAARGPAGFRLRRPARRGETPGGGLSRRHRPGARPAPVFLQPGFPHRRARHRALGLHRRPPPPVPPSRPGESLDRQGPVAATRMRLHRVRGYRELHAGLSPWLRVLLCQPEGLDCLL